jgi:Histidine kinase-like ATPase domain
MTTTRAPAPGAWPIVADAGHLLLSALRQPIPDQDTPGGTQPLGWAAARPAGGGGMLPPPHKPLDITLLARVADGLKALRPQRGHQPAVYRPEDIPAAEARDADPRADNPAAWPLLADLGPLGALPTAPRLVRSFATLVLPTWGLAAFKDDAELLLSELATNAVAVATSPDGRPRYDASGALHLLWARLLSDRERLRLEVWDTVPQEMGVPVQRQAQATDESGRGLELLDLLSADWGWEPMSGRAAKKVWAELTRLPDGEAARAN